MMEYIADTLGIKVAAEPWDGAAHLPFYLTDASLWGMRTRIVKIAIDKYRNVVYNGIQLRISRN
jgi:hypothetical protein